MIWGGAKLLEDPLDVVQKFKAWLIVGFNWLLQFKAGHDWKAGWFMNILDLLEAENLSYLWYILHPGDQRGGKVMMEDNTLIQRIFFCFPSLLIEAFPNQKWVTHRTSALVCCTISMYFYLPLFSSKVQKRCQILMLPNRTDFNLFKLGIGIQKKSTDFTFKLVIVLWTLWLNLTTQSCQ